MKKISASKKKVISKKLDSTKNKVSKKWNDYREKKEKILNRKLSSYKKQELVSKLYDSTRSQIKYLWKTYSGQKYSMLHVSEYYGLAKEKEVKTKRTIQKFYKVKNVDGFNLDSFVPDVLQENNVAGLMVIMECQLPTTGQIVYISDYINLQKYDRILEVAEVEGSEEEIIMDYLVSKASFLAAYDGYKLLNIHLRIIYNK